MAIVRCAGHPPEGRKTDYVTQVEPVGGINSAIICGLKTCEKPGLIWLNASEQTRYVQGHKIFELSSYAVKVKAK